MKKCFALMLAVLLLLSMTGCATLGALALPSATPTPEPTAAPTAAPTATPAAEPTTEPTSEPTPEPTPVPTTVDDYVGLYSHTELSYSDANGGYSYNYMVPQFLLDTEDAKAANADIQERCLPRIEAMKEAAEQGYSLTLLGISYDAWLEDGLVTLILTVSYDAGCTYYTVYRLQAETGAPLSNEDMAARLGVSMEQYYALAYEAMSAEFESLWGGARDAGGAAFYDEQLENTLSDENVRAAQLYLDKNGMPCIQCKIYSLAGASSYEYLLSLPIG